MLSLFNECCMEHGIVWLIGIDGIREATIDQCSLLVVESSGKEQLEFDNQIATSRGILRVREAFVEKAFLCLRGENLLVSSQLIGWPRRVQIGYGEQRA